jgi:hypothetical protein
MTEIERLRRTAVNLAVRLTSDPTTMEAVRAELLMALHTAWLHGRDFERRLMEASR